MHGHNINLPVFVCVRVCVLVTLSVNSPTGQTPQRIFTVDSLTDADLRKARMCLLGVSMMNNHVYGSKVPQKPHFGGLNRHFKLNMRTIQIAISSDLCIRLIIHLTGSCGQQQKLRGWSRMVVKQFQDGERAPFWKSIYRHISAKNHPISMKFCIQHQMLNWMNVTWSKMKRSNWTDSLFDRTYFFVVAKTKTETKTKIITIRFTGREFFKLKKKRN